ncbi:MULTISPECIES: response regulator transcription factor [Clostridium]|uniref:Stage 0 sporulation protein A homolog n=3 Tax=Clostridium TaxID=1485 RepID=D8GLZ4_CLOLD|nr:MULTISPECIES: response regulator transcription factor [Clostridium]ADK15568.1 predicted two-component response regulator [Clostridium ljungdahlii DSM 13528]AGY74807.1 response regulator transcription factor [Clostridium autoethanogenum DSM 10061]ALU34985.1 Response regulators consisting of a CheY-like receiver domain and a winged-helix DNA-binding domain [Clostridium autoethanogenum DSM 10061]OAA85426.1 Transcriptional regulatory protein SrrA [Clostridium ljungdahlii DSM 13528]OVY51625.1 Tr
MNKTILMVDDEERMRFLIEAYLKSEGLNMIPAGNGQEALEKFNENHVDLVVLDIMMPVMDGWTACKELRKISNVPIIMLTARAEDEEQLLGFQLGTDSYVTKPVSPKVLVAKIKALLKRTYSEEENQNKQNSYDGLYINREGHEVKVDDENVYLSPKEFELLCYLIKNKDIVLSREKILDAIWGIDYYGDLRTVDTHVKRLREKLGVKSYLIATVRGVGYKFEVKKQ